MIDIPLLEGFTAMYEPEAATPFPVLDMTDADLSHALTLLCSGMQVGD